MTMLCSTPAAPTPVPVPYPNIARSVATTSGAASGGRRLIDCEGFVVIGRLL